MKKKIFISLVLFFFLNQCEYKPIYSEINKINLKLNIIDIQGDDEMNNLVKANLEKYSNLSSNKEFNLEIKTSHSKVGIVKNKKGETTSFLITNQINFHVINNKINKKYSFSDKIRTSNNNNKFELKKYEKSIKNNFINSKINELIIKLSDLQ
ncbi:hypothetical protein [Candidatus Pelagibacter sp.]|uniref:hypothetical protein n=1 Tax=Candidatus Pelagibacter sp. TaxID=2024849 RepID=UPI003F849641